MSGFWQAKRVFVTGATGLVGSWLVRELIGAGAHVAALIRDWDAQSELIRAGLMGQISVVNGDIEHYATLERALVEYEIDTVFHLAARTILGAALRSSLGTFEAHVRGTYNLLEACRRQGDLVARVVVASSGQACGATEILPDLEAMAPPGRYPYDVAKAWADLIAQSYYHIYGLPVALARCGNIYGGGDLNWSRVVPGTIRSLYFGERPVLRNEGGYTRDYVYVEDAVKACMLLAEALGRPEVRGEAFHFGPAQPHTVREVVTALQRLMRREDLAADIRNPARAGIREQDLPSEKAGRLLDWRPQFALDEGLARSVVWYRDFFGRAA